MEKKIPAWQMIPGILFSLILFINFSSSAQGGIDASFSGGTVTTNFGFGETTEAANKVLLQPDGKIILAGGGGKYSKLARYNPDGTLDNSFGTEGKVAKQVVLDNTKEEISDIILLPDGAILAAGYGITDDLSDYFFVTKFLANGSTDNNFATQIRHQHEEESGYYSSIGLRSDGKIIWTNTGSYFRGTFDDGTTHGTQILRLLSDGSAIDAGYFDETIRGKDVLILSNNDFLICGMNNFALAKYSADLAKQGGTASAGFANLGGDAIAMAQQADGKIILVGQVRSDVTNYDFGVTRYNSDGSLDNDFGTNGKVITDLGGTLDAASGIVIQPDGKIIVTGKKEVADDTTFAAVRYLSSGELDPCFGTGGKLIIVLLRSWATSTALQPDGKIILAGFSNTDFAVARYVPSTEAPPTWYLDADGDGYGDDNTTQVTCTQPPGQVVKVDPLCIDNPTIPFMCPTKVILWVTNGGDCNDNDAAIKPGATEVCDGKDNDCDGQTDEGLTTTTYYIDADGDGYGAGTGIEYCSNPGAGYTTQAGDCNDGDASIHPTTNGTVELCDGIDNDCDGVIDEGCSGKPTLSITDVTVYESEGKAVLTIKLSHITTLQVKVAYNTADGTAVSNKKEKDYKSIGSTMLTIPPGTLTTTITVPVYNDGKTENNEYFYVNLSKPSNCLLSDVSGMVTILDGAPITSARNSIAAPIQNEVREQTEIFLQAKAFPNPSSTSFTVQIDGGDGTPVDVRIFNSMGQVVKALRSADRTLRFGDELQKGMYILEMRQGSIRKTIKLVKQ